MATAREILERMARVYAECRTYRDSGVVRTVFTREPRFTSKLSSTTAFVRPDRFRFEFRDSHLGESHRYLVWSRGVDVRTWSSIDPLVEESRDLHGALAAAHGVSACSSTTVPELLHGLPGRPCVTDAKDAERQPDADLDGKPCFVLRCDYPSADNGELFQLTLWIDQETFLLRRIDDTEDFTERTTTYEPVLDEEIPESLLVFDPPAREGR